MESPREPGEKTETRMEERLTSFGAREPAAGGNARDGERAGQYGAEISHCDEELVLSSRVFGVVLGEGRGGTALQTSRSQLRKVSRLTVAEKGRLRQDVGMVLR